MRISESASSDCAKAPEDKACNASISIAAIAAARAVL
jgi:hypothetical protein